MKTDEIAGFTTKAALMIYCVELNEKRSSLVLVSSSRSNQDHHGNNFSPLSVHTAHKTRTMHVTEKVKQK